MPTHHFPKEVSTRTPEFTGLDRLDWSRSILSSNNSDLLFM